MLSMLLGLDAESRLSRASNSWIDVLVGRRIMACDHKMGLE